MGIVRLLASLFKAIPSLERLVFRLADALKEANAKNRLEDKLGHIDALIDGERVQHRSQHRNTKVRFQHGGDVWDQHRNPVAAPNAKSGQRGSQPAATPK